MSWNRDADLSPRATLAGVVVLILLTLLTLGVERCAAGAVWLAGRARVAWILATLALVGCSSASPKRLCAAVSDAGRVLTISGQALRQIHDLDVEVSWRSECDPLSEIPARVVCRHRVVDEIADRYRSRYATAEQVVAAQHELADALEATGLCKAGAP